MSKLPYSEKLDSTLYTWAKKEIKASEAKNQTTNGIPYTTSRFGPKEIHIFFFIPKHMLTDQGSITVIREWVKEVVSQQNISKDHITLYRVPDEFFE